MQTSQTSRFLNPLSAGFYKRAFVAPTDDKCTNSGVFTWYEIAYMIRFGYISNGFE